MPIQTRTTTVYPKVSGLAAWSENCKWYSSLPLDAVVSLLCESAITLCVASQRVFIVVVIVVYFIITQSGNFWIHLRKTLCH
jgi:hypothetical protein